jgi:hypothetical protein
MLDNDNIPLKPINGDDIPKYERTILGGTPHSIINIGGVEPKRPDKWAISVFIITLLAAWAFGLFMQALFHII